MEAYFDNAATTKVFPEVKDLVVKLMEEDYGNPSSLHQKGLDAGHYIKETKEILAKEWKVDSKEIVLTSGGTESNNLALIGAALANKRSGNRIITTKVEHASVSSTMAFLERLWILLFDNLCNLLNRFYCPDLVIYIHNRHKNRILIHFLFQLFQIHNSVLIYIQIYDFKSKDALSCGCDSGIWQISHLPETDGDRFDVRKRA